MRKAISQPRILGMAIVAIGVVLLVLSLSAMNSGGGDGLVQDDAFPRTRDFYTIGGIILIAIGGVTAIVSARRFKNIDSRNNPGPDSMKS